MKEIALIFTLILSLSIRNGQKEANFMKAEINNLAFIEEKWKATAQDSTFSSVLEYRFSPKKRLLVASNNLYGKEGNLFVEYGVHILWRSTNLFILLRDQKEKRIEERQKSTGIL